MQAFINNVSVQLSCSVMFEFLQPHGLKPSRLSCPSPTPGACTSSCPSSQWCHTTISYFVIPFSSFLQSFPAPGSFLMSQLFTSSGQSIGTSVWASVLPVNIQNWFLLGLTFFYLLAVQGTLKSSPTPQFKSITTSSELSFLYGPTLTSIHATGKTIALTRQTFVGKLVSLLFNMMSRIVKSFLPRSKCLLISWLQSPSAVILEFKKIKSVTVSIVSPNYLLCNV